MKESDDKQNDKDKDDDKDGFKIIVNGREKKFKKNEITFEDVVRLAFENPDFQNQNIVYTVTYKDPQGKREGSLVAGKKVDTKDNMVFNVTRTDKS